MRAPARLALVLTLGTFGALAATSCTSSSSAPPPAGGNDGGACQAPGVSEACATCLGTSCRTESSAVQSDCAPVISCYCACNLGDTCCVEACGPSASESCVGDAIGFAQCAAANCATECTVVASGACVSDGGIDASRPLDGGQGDTGAADAGMPADSGAPEAGSDSGAIDSGQGDSGQGDTGPVDSGTADTGAIDSGPGDTGVADSGAADTGAPDAGPSVISIGNVFAHTILHSGFLVGTTTGAITSVEVAFDSVGYASATGTTSWSFALPAFKIGTSHTVVVRAHDASGIVGPVAATFHAGTNEDVNGDGFPDLLVGAPSSLDTGTGTAYLYASKGGIDIATGASVLPTTTFTGAGEYFGYSVALGDVNGDGYADILVGDDTAAGGNGAAYVFDGLAAKGQPAVLASAAKTTISGATGEALGTVAAGDIDGDGYADLVVGAQQAGGVTLPGAIYVFKSKGTGGIPSGASSTATSTLSGPSGGRMGVAVSVGDANGDGYADILAGAWGSYINPTTTPGSAYVFTSAGAAGIASGAYSGATTALTDTLEQFGQYLVLADVNGDGYDDAIVANLYDNNYHGAVYAFQSRGASGIATATTAHPTTVVNGAASSFLGASVAVGDVNGDGFGDLIAGAPGGTTNEAYVYVSAGSSGLTTSAAAALSGPPASGSDQYGCAVSGLDVNGDGFADVSVGANSDGAGAVFVFRSAGSAGVASTAYASASSALSAPGGASQFGTAIAP